MTTLSAVGPLFAFLGGATGGGGGAGRLPAALPPGIGTGGCIAGIGIGTCAGIGIGICRAAATWAIRFAWAAAEESTGLGSHE